jgi:hypothetical protein
MAPRRDYTRAAARALESIASWCPGYVFGRVKGDERWICSPLREDKSPDSFSINETTGQWHDFATDDSGHDALALYAKIKQIKNGQAYAEIMGDPEAVEDDYYIDPDTRARNIASLANEELKKVYEQLTQPSPSSFPLVRYGLMTLAPPKWLIKGMLEDNSLGVVFGPSGAGKSFFVLDMAACIASGQEFHGRPTKVQGAVVYVAGEGHAGLSRRIKAWELYNKATLQEAPLYVSTKAAALCDPEFMAHVKKSVEVVGQKQRVALIIIDTWARNMAGDENSTVDTTAAIRAVDELRALYQCTALIVHHSGQAESERGRGSSALRAALDIEYKVEINNDIMIVKNTKTKDGEAPEPMTLAFESVDLGIFDEDSEPVFSSALVEVVLDDILPKKRKGAVQNKIMELLRQNNGMMEKAALRAQMPETIDCSFYKSLKALKESGEIVADEIRVWVNAKEEIV